MKHLVPFGTSMLLLAGKLPAAAPDAGLGITFGPAKGSGALSVPMQIILVLSLLAVLPAVIMSVTPFLRITVVLHFLRQASQHAGHALQPGPDRTGAVLDAGDYAARGRRYVPQRLGAV